MTSKLLLLVDLMRPGNKDCTSGIRMECDLDLLVIDRKESETYSASWLRYLLLPWPANFYLPCALSVPLIEGEVSSLGNAVLKVLYLDGETRFYVPSPLGIALRRASTLRAERRAAAFHVGNKNQKQVCPVLALVFPDDLVSRNRVDSRSPLIPL